MGLSWQDWQGSFFCVMNKLYTFWKDCCKLNSFTASPWGGSATIHRSKCLIHIWLKKLILTSIFPFSWGSQAADTKMHIFVKTLTSKTVTHETILGFRMSWPRSKITKAFHQSSRVQYPPESNRRMITPCKPTASRKRESTLHLLLSVWSGSIQLSLCQLA